MITAPPLKVGALNAISALEVPNAVGLPIDGASGTDGFVVVALDALEALEAPTEFSAITVNE